MLDTLKLSLVDYEISPDADLKVRRPDYNAQTGECDSVYPLWRRGDGYVEGKLAYNNDHDMHITVQPDSPSEPMAIGCYVQFSVPKVADGDNYQPADFKTTKTSLRNVQRTLTKLGIKTNIGTARISRLDSCKNAVLEEPFQAYRPVLATLHGQRMKERGYESGFLFHNSLQQICVYDKNEEMRHRKHSLAGVPKNSVRFEHRLLKSRKVRDVLNFGNVTEMMEGFEQIGVGYRAAMEKQLFKNSPEEMQVMTAQTIANELTRLRASRARVGAASGSRWLNDWLVAYAIHQLGADADALLLAVEQVAENRMTANRLRKKIETARLDALSMAKSGCSKRTLSDLYREMEQQVLN